jgi:hypothetical protein
MSSKRESDSLGAVSAVKVTFQATWTLSSMEALSDPAQRHFGACWLVVEPVELAEPVPPGVLEHRRWASMQAN